MIDGRKGSITGAAHPVCEVAIELKRDRALDRAIQLFGAMGLTPDTPLADLRTGGRALRLADGPDEVHLRTVARDELGRVRERPGRSVRHCTSPERLG